MAHVLPFASRRFAAVAPTDSDELQLMQFMNDIQIIIGNRRAAFDVLAYQAQQFADAVRATMQEGYSGGL